MRETINGLTSIAGRVQAHRVLPGGRTPLRGAVLPGLWTPLTPLRPNLVMYDWATIVGKLMTAAGGNYRIAGMYIEYQNVGSAGDTVTAPSYTRYDGISYYQSLSSSGDKDFLRVPLVASTLLSDDTTMFPGGNDMTFFAQTSAGSGIGTFGKPFNDTAISKVYGAALVAMPVQGDYTQDLVFSRYYFDAGDQQAKLSTSQLGIGWEMALQ